MRDHRSPSNWTAYAYMMLEGVLREFGGHDLPRDGETVTLHPAEDQR
jgi:hypothetical protein